MHYDYFVSIFRIRKYIYLKLRLKKILNIISFGRLGKIYNRILKNYTIIYLRKFSTLNKKRMFN